MSADPRLARIAPLARTSRPLARPEREREAIIETPCPWCWGQRVIVELIPGGMRVETCSWCMGVGIR